MFTRLLQTPTAKKIAGVVYKNAETIGVGVTAVIATSSFMRGWHSVPPSQPQPENNVHVTPSPKP